MKLKVDWQMLALNLRRHGSLRQISTDLGMHKDYLSHIARKEIKEPKFSDGINMLNLHVDLCGREKTRELYRGKM
jgi:hypothetical protein